jgi:hypothetical protein
MTAIRDTQTSNVTRQQREPLSGRPRPTLFVSSLGRFLRLLADALASGGWLAFDQAIFKAESIQVFHGLSRSAQGLFLGLLEKCCALPVEFLNALDRLNGRRSLSPTLGRSSEPKSVCSGAPRLPPEFLDEAGQVGIGWWNPR